MAFEVIDGDQRLVCRQRQRLGHDQPDEDTADQAGAGGCRYGVNVVKLHSRFGEDILDQLGEDLDMGASGDLGDDAAIGPVGRFLPGELVGEHPPSR